uniref:Uncharacterized protein n=1 Tax=Lutzomyia longipalpis TaxID=7200 RepID=A0A1B0GGU2_LUTLO
MNASEFFDERDKAMDAANEVLKKKRPYEARVRAFERKVKAYIDALEKEKLDERKMSEIRRSYNKKLAFLKNYN